ncbi:hypothetical protein OBBRIDRAFT_836185 [Obba rivulosa]|uniref:Uncharacterized protein n=1 Tax=Obba rivulosa TaxID=1052685 RepID=A0A8E2B0N1_9APHY|nr:hypothetical protein OBBRIDRAFT_836185 [Obba rivulosa]
MSVQFSGHTWKTEITFRAGIVTLVGKIKDEPRKSDTVYGILFSGYHIAIVRVTRDGPVTHTATMQFLPSFYTKTPSTSGITALARLGYLKDDEIPDKHVDPSAWEVHRRKVHPYFRSAGLLDRLPMEILQETAEHLILPEWRVQFARISPRTLAASSGCLRDVHIGKFLVTSVSMNDKPSCLVSAMFSSFAWLGDTGPSVPVEVQLDSCSSCGACPSEEEEAESREEQEPMVPRFWEEQAVYIPTWHVSP